MKTFDFDWTPLVSVLPMWELLPISCREFFVHRAETNRRMPLRSIDVDVTRLLDEGFLEHAKNPDLVRVSKSRLPFLRTMRVLIRCASPMAASLGIEELRGYLDAHFSRADQRALGSRGITPARRLSEVYWLEGFLRALSFRAWEDVHRSDLRRNRRLFESDDCFRKAKRIVEILMSGLNPLRFSDLAAALGVADLSDYAAAIRAAVGYGLLFPASDATDLVPVIGIWPGIHMRLHRPKAPSPSACDVGQTFHRAYRMDDMTAMLVACVGKPLRLRKEDLQFSAGDTQRVAGAVDALPEWLPPATSRDIAARVNAAHKALLSLDFCEKTVHERETRLLPTRRGSEWLTMPACLRLRTIIDMLREDAEREYDPYVPQACRLPFAPLGTPCVTNGQTVVDIRPSFVQAFARLPRHGFVPLDEFLRYESYEANPWLRLRREGKLILVSDFVWGGHGDYVSDEELEHLWAQRLKEFLTERLVPLGGVRMGRTAEGQLALCPTEAGYYLLGLADEFEYGEDERAEVVAQPNFDIVFVLPCPAAEAGISRFAERVGHKVGTLFRLTQQSIFEAFLGGLTADRVLTALAEVSVKPLPGNVENQVRDWFASCRRADISEAVLIRCPDEETALRVQSIGGRKLRPLSSTVLELADVGYRRALERKLLRNRIAV